MEYSLPNGLDTDAFLPVEDQEPSISLRDSFRDSNFSDHLQHTTALFSSPQIGQPVWSDYGTGGGGTFQYPSDLSHTHLSKEQTQDSFTKNSLYRRNSSSSTSRTGNPSDGWLNTVPNQSLEFILEKQKKKADERKAHQRFSFDPPMHSRRVTQTATEMTKQRFASTNTPEYAQLERIEESARNSAEIRSIFVESTGTERIDQHKDPIFDYFVSISPDTDPLDQMDIPDGIPPSYGVSSVRMSRTSTQILQRVLQETRSGTAIPMIGPGSIIPKQTDDSIFREPEPIEEQNTSVLSAPLSPRTEITGASDLESDQLSETTKLERRERARARREMRTSSQASIASGTIQTHRSKAGLDEKMYSPILSSTSMNVLADDASDEEKAGFYIALLAHEKEEYRFSALRALLHLPIEQVVSVTKESNPHPKDRSAESKENLSSSLIVNALSTILKKYEDESLRVVTLALHLCIPLRSLALPLLPLLTHILHDPIAFKLRGLICDVVLSTGSFGIETLTAAATEGRDADLESDILTHMANNPLIFKTAILPLIISAIRCGSPDTRSELLDLICQINLDEHSVSLSDLCFGQDMPPSVVDTLVGMLVTGSFDRLRLALKIRYAGTRGERELLKLLLDYREQDRVRMAAARGLGWLPVTSANVPANSLPTSIPQLTPPRQFTIYVNSVDVGMGASGEKIVVLEGNTRNTARLLLDGRQLIGVLHQLLSIHAFDDKPPPIQGVFCSSLHDDPKANTSRFTDIEPASHNTILALSLIIRHSSSSSPLRIACIYALCDLGSYSASSTVGDLLFCLNDNDAKVRAACARALGSFGGIEGELSFQDMESGLGLARTTKELNAILRKLVDSLRKDEMREMNETRAILSPTTPTSPHTMSSTVRSNSLPPAAMPPLLSLTPPRTLQHSTHFSGSVGFNSSTSQDSPAHSPSPVKVRPVGGPSVTLNPIVNLGTIIRALCKSLNDSFWKVRFCAVESLGRLGVSCGVDKDPKKGDKKEDMLVRVYSWAGCVDMRDVESLMGVDAVDDARMQKETVWSSYSSIVHRIVENSRKNVEMEKMQSGIDSDAEHVEDDDDASSNYTVSSLYTLTTAAPLIPALPALLDVLTNGLVPRNHTTATLCTMGMVSLDAILERCSRFDQETVEVQNAILFGLSRVDLDRVGIIKSGNIVNVIERACHSPIPLIKRAALHSLSHVYTTHQSHNRNKALSIPTLTPKYFLALVYPLLRDTDPLTREAAATTLARCGAAGELLLIEGLQRDTSSQIRAACARGLGVVGEGGVGALLSGLADRDSRVVECCLKALKVIGERKVARAITSMSEGQRIVCSMRLTGAKQHRSAIGKEGVQFIKRIETLCDQRELASVANSVNAEEDGDEEGSVQEEWM
ncbi:hypothetical protein BLNAU_3671 [Blattamonas nauphoetae]|uniref:Uncharacterized protein n=1 Tax=Blattamonas nauphoetae TaxID=2049346 RepID=A0ABQ9YBT2_9EUKA|nr:hypothetical protein BLNAU_3671 [Blattamonas nauphoetae]